jgi:hypothetical protein
MSWKLVAAGAVMARPLPHGRKSVNAARAIAREMPHPLQNPPSSGRKALQLVDESP